MCPGINAKEYQEASGTEEAEEPGTAWNKNLPGMWQGICTKNRKAGVLRISVPKSENTKNGIDLEIESRSKGKSEKSREKEAEAEILTCRYKHQGKGSRNDLWQIRCLYDVEGESGRMIETVYGIGLVVGFALVVVQWIATLKGEKDATN